LKQRTTRRHILENDTLHNHRCENLKSYIFNITLCILYYPQYTPPAKHESQKNIYLDAYVYNTIKRQ
jgi:hypothetical protein